jgi:hypothetical protein
VKEKEALVFAGEHREVSERQFPFLGSYSLRHLQLCVAQTLLGSPPSFLVDPVIVWSLLRGDPPSSTGTVRPIRNIGRSVIKPRCIWSRLL